MCRSAHPAKRVLSLQDFNCFVPKSKAPCTRASFLRQLFCDKWFAHVYGRATFFSQVFWQIFVVSFPSDLEFHKLFPWSQSFQQEANCIIWLIQRLCCQCCGCRHLDRATRSQMKTWKLTFSEKLWQVFVYTSKFHMWQVFLVIKKLARQLSSKRICHRKFAQIFSCTRAKKKLSQKTCYRKLARVHGA